ncbi:MAG: glycosyltransferase family 4 protein [Anaerolineae bacterium]|nr:glycosyltransferase family 4 protein [Anaerolineae bacterium]
MSRRHVLFLCSEYPPSPGGGIGTFYQTLARALANCGWQVSVGGIFGDVRTLDVSVDNGVTVWRIPPSRNTRGRYRINMFLDRWRLGRWVRQMVRQHNACLVDAADYQGWMWGVTEPIPRVTRLHGADIMFQPLMGRKPERVKAYLERSSLQHSTGIISSSHFMSMTVQPHLRKNQRVDATIYNMVDVQRFAPSLAIRRNPLLVASVATLTPKKGVYQLLNAWEAVHKHEPHARLRFYGRDTPDGDHSTAEVLRRRCNELNIADSVEIVGPVPYHLVCRVFQESGILVFPSYVEAHPRAWLEGMATGAPVIGSNRGPGPEVIEHGRTGLIVDPDDTEELSNAILDLLRAPDKATQLGVAARSSMIARYSIDAILQQNVDFYIDHILAARVSKRYS